MKKIFFAALALSLAVCACATSNSPSVPSGGAVTPSPISQVDLQATSAVMAEQTLQAMPTFTLPPSNTPVVKTESPTNAPPSPTMQVTATETQNPILLTLTATLGTGTPFTITPGGTVFPTSTLLAGATAGVATGTGEVSYPQTYGTMPPNLPSGKISVSNQTKTQATVSLQCTTRDGYFSEIDLLVGSKSKVGAKLPSGSCAALAWVDGKKFSTSFSLSPGGNVMVIITAKGMTAK